MFHHIPPEQMAALDRLLGYLKQHFSIISPDEAAAWLLSSDQVPSNILGKTSYLITFDDGFISNEVAAREVLARHEVSALFFVCPGLIETPSEDQPQAVLAQIFERTVVADKFDPHLQLMTWLDLKGLIAAGHTVGAHGMRHNRLSALTGEALKNEIVESGDVLEARIDHKVDWFAYAFGDLDSISADALSIILQRFKFCRSGIRGGNIGNSRCQFSDQLGLDQPFAYQKFILAGGLDFMYRRRRNTFSQLIGMDRSS
jgi:peptidoglycan/xylan/chitin deacetylase (PgdA/CDA1 family)